MTKNLILIALIVWGVVMTLTYWYFPRVKPIIKYQPEPYTVIVGDGNVKDCTDKGGDFKAVKEYGYVRATCTLPSSTIVY